MNAWKSKLGSDGMIRRKRKRRIKKYGRTSSPSRYPPLLIRLPATNLYCPTHRIYSSRSIHRSPIPFHSIHRNPRSTRTPPLPIPLPTQTEVQSSTPTTQSQWKVIFSTSPSAIGELSHAVCHLTDCDTWERGSTQELLYEDGCRTVFDAGCN